MTTLGPLVPSAPVADLVGRSGSSSESTNEEFEECHSTLDINLRAKITPVTDMILICESDLRGASFFN